MSDALWLVVCFSAILVFGIWNPTITTKEKDGDPLA